MRNLLFFILFVFTLNTTNSQGWRKDEMEVRIDFETVLQKDLIYSMNLNGDIYPDYALLYVTPDEFKQLKEFGLRFEILKEDLNEYFKDFWETRDAYHTYQEIIDLMDSLAIYFPLICEKNVYGSSLGGRELSALKISDNVGVDEPEPEVMFDGGIHGDEIGGPENLIRFARHLCLEYGTNPDITELIDNREIWIYPMANPDGRVNLSRYNNNGVDLNRDWGYMWDAWGSSNGPYGEVESKALLECVLENQFNIHVTFHSGIEYFLYAWYYRPDLSPDDASSVYLSQLYTSVSGYSNLPFGHAYNSLYPTNGTSGEAYYGVMGSYGFTQEISYDKQPPVSQIMYYYTANLPSMIEMIRYAGYGIKGIVTDSITGQPVQAAIKINDFLPVYNDPVVGDFHKFTVPGVCDITVVANGYQPKTITNVIVGEYTATEVNFELVQDSSHYAYRFCSSRIPDNNYGDEGNTPASLGPPDNVNYSVGKSGWCVLDLQEPILDGPGNDIMVFEGDFSPEGYTCYASNSLHGPWQELGEGVGTSGFDLGMAGMAEARYYRIKDDGDGPASGNDAGFDLDAVAATENISGVYLALYSYEIDDQQTGNGNGKLDPGETADLVVTLRNNGDILAEEITGTIQSPTPFINILSGTASFGNLGQGELGTSSFTVEADLNTPNGTFANINMDVSANNGTYTNSYTFDFIIGQVPALVVDLDPNQSSWPAMEAAVLNNGLAVEYVSSLPADPQLYASVFVCLGIYSSNHVLSSGEGQLLAEYLNTGGNLYMEGGDTWYYDDQTAVHAMFNINGVSDGSGDMGTVNGQNSTFTESIKL